MSIKFISYDGKYPNLCSGSVVFLHNGEKKILENIVSGGSCYWNSEKKEEVVGEGEWELPYNFSCKNYGLTQEEADELLRQINENVPYGCCGGCM